jgi:hypothetical protein
MRICEGNPTHGGQSLRSVRASALGSVPVSNCRKNGSDHAECHAQDEIVV